MIKISDNKNKTLAIITDEDLPIKIEKEGIKPFYVKKGTKEGSGFYGNSQK